MALIEPDELATYLGVTIDEDQAELIIANAGGILQRFCDKVQLEQVVDDEITLRGSYSYELRLPRGPVSEVSEVAVNGVTVDDWRLVKDRLIRTGIDTGPFTRPTTPHWGGPDVEISVIYTHGLETAPADVRAVCFDLCARARENPTGVRSRQSSIDGYERAVVYAGDGSDISTAMALNAAQKAALADYHTSSYSVDTAA
jgi:hypothetical protein